MRHLKAFEDALNSIRDEGRYRVFVDLQRHRGAFPKATARFEDGEREITVWCSNDYLGMGQDDDVLEAMHSAIDNFGGIGIDDETWQDLAERRQRRIICDIA